MRRAPLWILLSLLPLGCASAPPATTATTAATAAEAIPAPATMPDSVHWVRNSAEYHAAAIQAYHLATQQVEKAAAGLESGTWAVILDADETVLDNSQYQKERAGQSTSFTSESWNEWVKRVAAPPVPGAVTFLTRVHDLGGKVAIVTNRGEPVCGETQQDFVRYQIPFDVILCGSGDKNARWQKVADGTASPQLPPLKVVMWVGDNILDFPGLDQSLRTKPEDAFKDFGTRFIVIPNPMYGSWVGNPRN
ncbi:MAG TPA: HAD family acid phosphatase [Thermoanaerobaculia bacterium]|nr:HAD family acid phosphatase [Thermoanaerobaculia bacterium]